MKTIQDVSGEIEQAVTQALQQVLRDNYPSFAVLTPHVTLRYREGKPVRRNASAEYWSPVADYAELKFEAAAAQTTPAPQRAADAQQNPRAAMVDLIRALDRAENRPNFDFVSFKWFRDVVLAEEGFEWAASPTARQNILEEAIRQGVLLPPTRINNPKAPQYPTTTIRLNRQSTEVRRVLGEAGPQGRDFKPLPIRGEPLSATILRERG